METGQPRYRDRVHAGVVLGEELSKYAGQNAVVFGVGVSGVVIGEQVARALGADLDVLPVRVLTLPGEPEQAWGAIAALGDCIQVVAGGGSDSVRDVPDRWGDTARQRDLSQLRWLERTLRSGRPPEPIGARPVIVVSDAGANLAVMRAALSVVRRHGPAGLIAATPAGDAVMCRELRKDADEVICPVMQGLCHCCVCPYEDSRPVDVDRARDLLNSWNAIPPTLVGRPR